MDVHGNHGKDNRWFHLAVLYDGTKRWISIDGKQIAKDVPPKSRIVQGSGFYVGARPSGEGPGAQGNDPFRGSFSELRLWKRCLPDEELAMRISQISPPDDLVRWLCLTGEDEADPDGNVRNYASHGPRCMTVGSPIKPVWTTRADEGETDEERMGAARGVSRQANRLLALAVDIASAPLLDALVDREPLLRPFLASPPVLLGALVPRFAAAALRFISHHDLPISVDVCDALLKENSSDEGSRFLTLLLHGSNECADLINALVARAPKLRAAIDEKALLAALRPATAGVALQLIEKGVSITEALADQLIVTDSAAWTRCKRLAIAGGTESKLQALVADTTCRALINKLCAESAAIRAAMVSAEMLAAMARPSTADVALWLIDEKGLEISDEVVDELLMGQAFEYTLNTMPMSWQSHEDAAVAWGGQLASIHNLKEQLQLKALAKGQSCWLGGCRIEPRSGVGQGPEHWMWSDGSHWGYTSWEPGEPSDRTGRADRVLLQTSSHWNGASSYSARHGAIYKRSCRLVDSLVHSQTQSAAKLVKLLLAKAPRMREPVASVEPDDCRVRDVLFTVCGATHSTCGLYDLLSLESAELSDFARGAAEAFRAQELVALTNLLRLADVANLEARKKRTSNPTLVDPLERLSTRLQLAAGSLIVTLTAYPEDEIAIVMQYCRRLHMMQHPEVERMLRVALRGNCKQFIAQPKVQSHLRMKWRGELLATTIVFPLSARLVLSPLCALFMVLELPVLLILAVWPSIEDCVLYGFAKALLYCVIWPLSCCCGKKGIIGVIYKEMALSKGQNLIVYIRPFMILKAPMFKFGMHITSELTLAVCITLLPASTWPVAVEVAVLSLAAGSLWHELCELRTCTSLSTYLADFLNFIDLGGASCACAALAVRLAARWGEDELEPETPSLLAVAALCLWLKLMHLVRLHPTAGPLVLTIFKMLRVDIYNWMLVALVWLVAFSAAMQTLHMRSIAGQNGERDFLTCVQPDAFHADEWGLQFEWYLRSFFEFALLGEAPFECVTTSSERPTARLILYAFQGMFALVLVNLLIAQMSKTFDTIYETQTINALFLFHQTVTAWDDASLAPPPLNLLSIPHDVCSLCCKFTTWRGRTRRKSDVDSIRREDKVTPGDDTPPPSANRAHKWKFFAKDFFEKHPMGELAEGVAGYIQQHENDVAQEEGHRARVQRELGDVKNSMRRLEERLEKQLDFQDERLNDLLGLTRRIARATAVLPSAAHAPAADKPYAPTDSSGAGAHGAAPKLAVEPVASSRSDRSASFSLAAVAALTASSMPEAAPCEVSLTRQVQEMLGQVVDGEDRSVAAYPSVERSSEALVTSEYHPTACVLAGWLDKQPVSLSFSMTWKHRWFMLFPNRVLWSEGPQTAVLGELRITSGTRVEEPNGRLIIHGVNGRKLQLRGPEADLRTWSAAIKECLQHPDLLERASAATISSSNGGRAVSFCTGPEVKAGQQRRGRSGRTLSSARAKERSLSSAARASSCGASPLEISGQI